MKYTIYKLDPCPINDRTREYKLAIMKDGEVRSFAPWDIKTELDKYDIEKLYVFVFKEENIVYSDIIPEEYITDIKMTKNGETINLGYIVDSTTYKES